MCFALKDAVSDCSCNAHWQSVRWVNVGQPCSNDIILMSTFDPVINPVTSAGGNKRLTSRDNRCKVGNVHFQMHDAIPPDCTPGFGFYNAWILPGSSFGSKQVLDRKLVGKICAYCAPAAGEVHHGSARDMNGCMTETPAGCDRVSPQRWQRGKKVVSPPD